MELVKENVGDYTNFCFIDDDMILYNTIRYNLKFCHNNLEINYYSLTIFKKRKIIIFSTNVDNMIYFYTPKGELIKSITDSGLRFRLISDKEENILITCEKIIFLGSCKGYNYNFYKFFDDYILFHYDNKIYHYTYNEEKIFEKEFINDKFYEQTRTTDDGYLILESSSLRMFMLLDKDYNIIFQSDNCYYRFNEDYIHIIENNNCYRFQINKLPSK